MGVIWGSLPVGDIGVLCGYIRFRDGGIRIRA